jgi:Arc/MetJ-type ribon-helix-helix transcriptional regulator
MPRKEQESSSILSVRLPDELIQRLDRYLDWWETARRVKSSRNAVMREALRQWLDAQEHEAGLVHAPTLRQQFRTASHRIAQGSHGVRIHRLRQVLQWPRERFDTVLEALRTEHHVALDEGEAGDLSARDIQDSYHVHGRLYITLRWRD